MIATFTNPNTLDRSQDVRLDALPVFDGTIYAVRDDLLSGGTKQRAAIPFLRDLTALGYTDFVYASPFCGFAQIALAAACRSIGATCHLYCEKDASRADKKLIAHAFTVVAQPTAQRSRLPKT